MAIVATDWTITRATKVIAYTGDVHTGVNPSYATVIEFHRWLQGLADDAVAVPSSSDQLDVTNIDPSRRSTDNIITLINGYTIDQTSSEHLYDGSVIQGTSGSDIWDGIVNFGNKGVLIQLHQNGSVVSDDWWNYSLGGSVTSAASATVVTDSALSTALSNRSLTTDDLIGFTLYNVTDGSHGIITSNTTGTITCSAGLFGGTANTFAVSDVYKVGLGVNRSVSAGISHRWMQKVRTSGTDVDLRKLLGTNRRFGYTYGEFSINATARGNNVLALSDSSDLNNATSETTVSGWQDVFIDRTDSTATVVGVNSTGQAILNVSNGALFADGDFIMWAGENSEYKIVSIATNALTLNRNLQVATAGGEAVYDLNIGYKSIDVDNNTTNENYYAVWDRGAKTINQFYEYGKYQTADGSTEQVYGLNGELFRGITHEINVDTQSATDFDAVEAVSWSGGTGQMLAINDRTGSSTKMWIQLLTGNAPVDNDTITGANSGATALVNVTVTERSISKPFVGASTGSALIGSYGLALQTADLSSSDKVTDLTNTVISPPNNVTNIVAGLANGEDRVLVAPWDGSTTDTNGDPAITKTQLAIKAASALTTDNITSVAVSTTIPSDTPSIGYIRVTDNNGFERRLHYTSWATDTFVIDTTDGNEDFLSVNANAGNNVWIAYVDALYSSTDTSGPGGQNGTDRFTSVQSGSRNLVVIVRDGGGTPIKQFISSWTQTSSNQTINAIRSTDI
ncbi:MAG: hypothetical protein HYT28_02360 [Parcubacteria group bacterium]|nr:hypothetical protein [Parcubacteria group bacterium]